MLYDSVWPLPTVALTVAALVAVGQVFTRQNHRWRLIAALVVLTFCSASAARIEGRRRANSDMREESPNLPLAAFSSESEAAKLGPPEMPSGVAYETFGAMDCKLLLHSKGAYIFFPTDRDVPG
jgi:hypothetical protein